MSKNSERSKAIQNFEPCETEWLSRLGEKAQEYYPTLWIKFRRFVNMKGSEIIEQRINDIRLREDDPNHWRFERLASEFYKSLYQNRDPAIPTNTDRMHLIVVQSFFAHNRMPLVFRRGEIEEAVSTEKYYEFSLRDLEAVKKFGTPKDRWIFFGGKSLGQRINDFLRIKRSDIEPLLSESPPVSVDIVTTKKNLIAHPCLDQDAFEAAKDLLATRTDSNPYMLASQNVADGKSMTKQAVGEAIKRVADTAHRADPTVFKYKERNENLRFHNFRVFLNAALQNAHVDPDLRDWIIGHKLSGTKKAYTSHQRIQAYNDASAYLLLPRREGLDDRLRAVEDTLKASGIVPPEFKLTQEKANELAKGGMEISIKGRRILKEKPSVEAPEEDLSEKSKKIRKERKIVSEEELDNHLNHGYDFVSQLPSGKVLIEREII